MLILLLVVANTVSSVLVVDVTDEQSCFVPRPTSQIPLSLPDWRVMSGCYLWVQRSIVADWKHRIKPFENITVCCDELSHCSNLSREVCTQFADNSTILQESSVDSENILGLLAAVSDLARDFAVIRPLAKAARKLPGALQQLNKDLDYITSTLDLIEDVI